MKIKPYALIALVVCIGLSLMGFSAGLLESSATIPFSGVIKQTPKTTYSYAISVSGSLYYAVNGTNGAVVNSWNSTSFNTVFNYVQGALSSGGEIYITDGNYQVTAKIAITNPNIWIEGNSWNTLLTLGNGVNTDMFGITGDNCTIENFQINGNYPGQTGPDSSGILVWNARDTIIKNMFIHSPYTFGIDITNNSTGTIVQDISIDNCGAGGIVVYGNNSPGLITTHDISISNCIIKNVGLLQLGDSLMFSGATNSTATNCVFDRSSDANFEVTAGETHSNNQGNGITASNLQCVNAGTDGILIDSWSSEYYVADVAISNFIIKNSTNNGIFVHNYVDNIQIGNGSIDGTGQEGIKVQFTVNNANFHNIIINNTASSGGAMANGVSYSTFSNLTVINTGGFGAISLTGESNSFNSVIDCIVQNVIYNGVYVGNAPNSLIQGNFVSGWGTSGINVANSNGTQIISNTIAGGTSYQILLSGDSYCTINRNNLQNPWNGDAIFVGAYQELPFNNLISENNFTSTNILGQTGIETYCATNTSIQNNYFNNYSIGVNVDSLTSISTIISDNIFANVTTPIIDYGTNTVIIGNSDE